MRYKDIASRNDLADFLGIKRNHLTFILYSKQVDNCYKSFEISKKSGGKRVINAPDASLKAIQKRIASVLWKRLQEVRKEKEITQEEEGRPKTRLNISHAFEKEKSIITNAKVHRKKRYVFNTDLTEFFDSFNFGRVRGFFEKNKDFCLPKDVATVVAQLTCYKGSLPQGAPSSPIITNLICQIMDFRLLKVAKKYKLDYTRYADDLTFSTNNRHFLDCQDDFEKELSRVIESSGFEINSGKTRLQFRDSRQVVTGLVVNQKPNPPIEYRKKTRAMAYNLYKHGEFLIDEDKGRICQLEGRFAFINQLDREHNALIKKIEEAKSTKPTKERDRRGKIFSSREMAYQEFLFYRYFYANEKILIITEGKTDIVYLRAALKKLHKKYPEFIIKKEDGSFDYRISFLRKTKRLRYFFGIDPGGDALANLYKYYSDVEFYMPNLFKYFNELCPYPAKNPVILLFDNETEGSERPLGKFFKEIKASKEQKEQTKKDLRLDLVEKSNLFLMTHQLVKGKGECEIEDLFDDDVLTVKINGKAFRRDAEPGSREYYGKVEFASYIAKHYESINFEGFEQIFNNIKKLPLSIDAKRNSQIKDE